MAYALGIDVGSTNVKVGLVADDGTVVASARGGLESVAEGDAVEQDPEALWHAVRAAIQAVSAEAPTAARETVAVGVASQYSSIVPVDEAGRAVGPLVMWRDRRGTDHCMAILERHGDAFATFVERHGVPPIGGGLSLAHVLYFQHDRPDVHARTAAYLEPMDFVTLRLTGRAVASQCSVFAYQLTDNRRLGVTGWDERLVAMAGVDPSRLPPLIAATEAVGALGETRARELGLPAAAVVYAGLNDSQVGAYATDAFAAGRGGLAIGTTSVLFDRVDALAVDLEHGIFAMPSPDPDTYLVCAENGLGGGALEHVLAHVVHAVDALADHHSDDAFARLDAALAASAPGAGGVLFLPWLTGSLAPAASGHMRGGFINMSITTTRTDLVRAAAEGVAHNLAWLLPHVEAFSGRHMDEILVAGGGARSRVWCQILADVLDRPIHPVASPEIAVARTAALLALRSHGARPGMVPVATHPPLVPRAAHRARYAMMQTQFEAAFAALGPISEALNA